MAISVGEKMNDYSEYNGVFVPNIDGLIGHLVISGEKSFVKLVGGGVHGFGTHTNANIYGTTSDGKKVSLIDCVLKEISNHHSHGGVQSEATFFPNFITIGDEFVNPDEETIAEVRYCFDNADKMISYTGTFREIDVSVDRVRDLLEEDYRTHQESARQYGWPEFSFEPEIGEYPKILLYSGRWEIMSSNVDIGRISLVNNTSHGFGDARGIGFKNKVIAIIEFLEPKNIYNTVHNISALHSLLELNLGGRQSYRSIDLVFPDSGNVEGESRRKSVRLQWVLCNERVKNKSSARSFDVLCDPNRNPDEFARIVAGWMNSDADMRGPRNRFSVAFNSRYGIDRIVGAANMFDLLPLYCVPKKVEQSAETKAAVDQCRRIFRDLPDSFARQSVLSALGRVGTASLRDKVLYRTKKLVELSFGRLVGIEIPCNHAIIARNYYVHGSDSSFDYEDNFVEFAFLTDTLEFVFAISDLIDLGWDFGAWVSRQSTLSHPFYMYVHCFPENMSRLTALIDDRV